MARANTSLDCCVHATSIAARMHDNTVLTLRFPDLCHRMRSQEADVARPGCPSRPGLAFRAAQLSINADNPGFETTTR